jgi:signal transduction histidine kinase
MEMRSRRGQQASIGRAKREWESTADALGALVCLLDHKGLIRRVNRVVEDWSLGSVSGVLGRPAHAVLHPDCDDPRCPLVRYLGNALAAVGAGRRARARLQCLINRRSLQFSMRPMRADEGRGVARFTVLIVEDATALQQTRAALERLNAGLELRVRTRTRALRDSNRELRAEIARRRGAEMALRRSRNELAVLSAQLIRAQESERKRIALELHDSVGQSLSAVKYTVERALGMVRQPRLGDSEAALTLSVRRIQETAEAIRAISANLRPRVLDDLGAVSALQWFCREFAETYPGIAVKVDLGVGDHSVPDRLSTVVFRCLQELMNNVAKHARANTVWVSLSRDADTLVLQVRDDGIGPPRHRGGRPAAGSSTSGRVPAPAYALRSPGRWERDRGAARASHCWPHPDRGRAELGRITTCVF